jgi:hypothetical protein
MRTDARLSAADNPAGRVPAASIFLAFIPALAHGKRALQPAQRDSRLMENTASLG